MWMMSPAPTFEAYRVTAKAFKERLKAQVHSLLLKRREMLFMRRFTTAIGVQRSGSPISGWRRSHSRHTERIRTPRIRRRIESGREFRRASGLLDFAATLPISTACDGFCRDVWPGIRKSVPGIRFRLVGKDTHAALTSGAPDVDALGWVADPTAEIASWSAMVIPIRLGGGTRVKVADAFSRKCPVVSTHLGAFGYDVKHGRELLLADDPTDFASACVSLIRHPANAAHMAERAYRAFLEKWTWDAIAPRVWAAAEDCLRRSSAVSSSETLKGAEPLFSQI